MQSFQSRLADGVPQLGLSIMYPSPGVIERIGGEWDWIWIDGQHGEFGYHDLLAMVRACDLVKRPAMVRVAGESFGAVGLALDAGAAGVIIPCVDTPEQATAAVNSAKFPPLGKRSYGGRRPIDLYGRTYSDTANRDTMLIVQIESPQAIEHVDAIAAIPGVDALFLGPDDIMLRRGYGMTTPRSRQTLGQDMEAVAAACRRHGKYAVMVGVGAEMLTLCLSMGFHMIVSGGDVLFLANGSRSTAAEARALIGERSSSSAAAASAAPPDGDRGDGKADSATAARGDAGVAGSPY